MEHLLIIQVCKHFALYGGRVGGGTTQQIGKYMLKREEKAGSSHRIYNFTYSVVGVLAGEERVDIGFVLVAKFTFWHFWKS